MALGTMTSVEAAQGNGPVYIDRVTVVGDASYPTGGATGLAAKLKALRKDGRTIVAVIDEGTATNKAEYDKANDKLLAYVRATGVEVANATNTSTTTFKLYIISK